MFAVIEAPNNDYLASAGNQLGTYLGLVADLDIQITSTDSNIAKLQQLVCELTITSRGEMLSGLELVQVLDPVLVVIRLCIAIMCDPCWFLLVVIVQRCSRVLTLICLKGAYLEQPLCLDILARIQCETMVYASGEDEQIACFYVDTYPLVGGQLCVRARQDYDHAND